MVIPLTTLAASSLVKHTAPFSLTRSARNDYLDPEYARLAYEARQLWLDLQQRSGQRLLIDCGCLNLAKAIASIKEKMAERRL